MADSYQNKCGPLLSPRHRQYIDHRTGYTKSGIATPADGSPPDIEGRARQAKSEIKKRRFSDELEAFANDMQRLEKFYTDIEQDRDQFRHMLFKNKFLIECLRREIQRWKMLADYEAERMDEIEESWQNRRFQLQDILSPLYNGLKSSENPEQEFHERYNALKTICKHDLVEIFDYIMTTSHQEQINQNELKQERDGWNWQRQVTEYLEKEHGLVKSEWWGDSKSRKMFTPKPRADAVSEALNSLLESEYIDQWQGENESRQKAAFKALSEPHNIGI